MCESISPGQAVPVSRTTRALRPAACRAALPTARIRPSMPDATSGSQPANSVGWINSGSPRTHGAASEFVGYSQSVGLGDDLLHDLVRPSADPRQAGVAPRALDRKLAHVAMAAEDLDRLVGHLACDLRREQLRLRHLAYRVRA